MNNKLDYMELDKVAGGKNKAKIVNNNPHIVKMPPNVPRLTIVPIPYIPKEVIEKNLKAASKEHFHKM